MVQNTTGLRYLLSLPGIYKRCMNFLGGTGATHQFVKSHIRPYSGIRILDLGAGPATILNFLPTETSYVGVDISQRYIDAARAKFAARGVFHCLPLESFDEARLKGFDLVMGLGVLHHLDDDQAGRFFALAYTALNNTGRCVTIDPCLVPDQHWLARLMIAMDRGRNIRNEKMYERLAASAFPEVSQIISHDRLRIPYTHLVMECRKS